MTTPNPMFAKFDQALGKTTPTPTDGTPMVTSRADEIRNLAKSSTPAPQESSMTGTLTKPLTEGVKGLGELYGGGDNGIASKLKNDVVSGASDIQKGDLGNVAKGVVKAGARTAGDVAGAVYAPVGAAVGATGVGGVFSNIESNLEKGQGLVGQGIDKLTNIPAVQEFAMKHPNAAEDFNRVLNLIMGSKETGKIEPSTMVDRTVDQVKALPGQVSEGINKVDNALGSVKGKVLNEKPGVLNEKSILDKYNRAIKPSVSGKSNAGQINQSNSKIISGVKAIADNKPSLSFTDSEGQTISGETPKTVDQMTQAIAQTKKTIFQKYDALAKQAGERGVTVEASSIAKELQPVVDSKSLAIANPKAVSYAKSLQDRLTRTGSVDAQTAQEVIQHYNDSLKAFYRNPSYDTASQASIDSMIANKFREQLDKGITGSTGKQYQSLKDQYGALSSMEKDVAHRNVVWGRQNKVGLVSNISDIASGAELLRGLVTMNPADIAISGTIKGIGLYNRYINNPDVNISKLFDEVNRVGSGQSSSSQSNGTKQADRTKPTKQTKGK